MVCKVLLRPLGSVVLLILLNAAHAQDFHLYRATLSGMSSTKQEKQLLEHLADVDPQGKCTLDRATGELEWKTVVRTDRIQFEYRIGRYQLGLVSFSEIGELTVPVVRSARTPRLADMPLYMDTGNPLLDNQRYDAYKAAWIAAHPDEYEELTAPRPIEQATNE